METVYGQPCWTISTRDTQLSMTMKGAHMAPVVFRRRDASSIRPYYISPWNREERSIPAEQPDVLVPLRGDFFCLPFGGNNTLGSESHPVHGEVAGSEWKLVSEQSSDEFASLNLRIETRARPGVIESNTRIVGGHDVVYQTHTIHGFAGPTTIAHHAILRADAPLRLGTAKLRFGITDAPGASHTANGEYYSLARGHEFHSFERVPTVWRDPEFADISTFPAREGFVDIVQVVPDFSGSDIGWFTATCVEEGWLWFALRDARLLPTTVLWMENRGRHGGPWNGLNRCIGIEDACAYLAQGLGPSVADNRLKENGIPTTVSLDSEQSLAVHYVQGVCRIPSDFDRAIDARFEPSSVTFLAASGATASAAVSVQYVQSGAIDV